MICADFVAIIHLYSVHLIFDIQHKLIRNIKSSMQKDRCIRAPIVQCILVFISWEREDMKPELGKEIIPLGVAL